MYGGKSEGVEPRIEDVRKPSNGGIPSGGFSFKMKSRHLLRLASRESGSILLFHKGLFVRYEVLIRNYSVGLFETEGERQTRRGGTALLLNCRVT